MSVTKVILPKLGLTMDEGKLVAWHKREGDRVEAGEVLFEVETDKATMEVEAPAAGILRKILVQPDAMVPVTTVVALLSDTADEPLGADVAGSAPSAPRAAAAASPASAPPAVAAPSDGRVAASPAARKRAQDLGVDISSVKGSGPGGRIQIEDVEKAATGAPAGGTDERRVPLSRMRKAIGSSMTASVREAPQFALSRDVDMSAANEQRKKAGASYTDVIVSAAARALRAHEKLRRRIEGDELVISEGVDVGLAVALEDGLLVPVLHDADRKDLAQLARERAALEDGARAGRLHADALSGAVITVSNLGTFGVDRFQAIVNPPEAAILAVGRVSDRVVARDGAPSVRPVATFTLSVDHRVADGADAARYLDAFADLLERGA